MIRHTGWRSNQCFGWVVDGGSLNFSPLWPVDLGYPADSNPGEGGMLLTAHLLAADEAGDGIFQRPLGTATPAGVGLQAHDS